MSDALIQQYSLAVLELLKSGAREAAKQLEIKLMTKGLYGGSVDSEEWLDKLITNDPAMLDLKKQVRALVPVDDSVLIIGETGTGKEIVARALHGSRGPYTPDGTNSTFGRFVAINCPALSVDLMFSELFGHVKGSFTGANEDKIGKLQYAYKGTLFIDEVGDMPLSMQSALLRALQERTIVRVGDNKEIVIEFRLVCATHRNLRDMIEKGLFREDLYYRISTFELHTTPLRRRIDDIKLIVASLDKKNKFPIDDYMKVNRELPGNVRELQRIVRRHAVLWDSYENS